MAEVCITSAATLAEGETVMQNCAFRNFSPSMYMNGIVPPSPMYIAGAPKYSWLAWSMACSSQGASAGAFQPVDDFSTSNSTVAP